ncbi:MAG: hypothetical protein N3B16_00350 [Candidatus Aminicenantes bacterium]|nr:hypothetical protein [Candidatus Aminicenantes bacterium]
MNYHKYLNTESNKYSFFLSILASAFFASFISPQIALKGRGLRLSLVLLMLLLGFVFLVKPRAYLSWSRHRITLVLGFIYVINGIVRYLIDPEITLFQNLIISALVCVIISMVVLVIREGFKNYVESIRWLTLIILGISLGMGIPILLNTPQVARLTMGNPLEDYYASLLYPKGVANYSWYTPVAIAFPVIANWIYRNVKDRIRKVISWGLLLAVSIATLLSSFMMASILLVIAAFVWLLLVAVKAKKKAARVYAIVIIAIIIFSLPTVFLIGADFQPTKFVIDKASKITENIRIYGLIQADETGRTEMLIRTINTFINSPILGGWGIDSNFYIGGHSSWGDILGSQGLVGLLLWIGFIYPSFKRNNKWLSIEDGSAGGTLSWILLFIGGVLNPTLHSSIALILIWLFDDGTAWIKKRQLNVVESAAVKNKAYAVSILY